MRKNTRMWIVGLAALGALIALQAFQRNQYHRQAGALANDSIVGRGRPVLLQISSASCPPCRRMLPILAELAQTEGLAFEVALVSLDKMPKAAETYGVAAIPTQIFYNGRGEELYRHTGMLSKRQILDRWRRLGIEEESSPESAGSNDGKRITP